MKNLLVLLVILGIVAYAERDKLFPPPPVPAPVVTTPTPAIVLATPTPKPTPTPPLRHLAPEGTFFMVEYVSARTPRGVTGFIPGERVKFVSADEANGTLLVTDGHDQVAVTPMQLTNDLDVADLARRQDQQSQSSLQSVQEAARQADEKARMQLALDVSKDVGKIRTSSGIGTSTTLQGSSEAASSFDRARIKRISGSPYYYLHPGYYNSGN